MQHGEIMQWDTAYNLYHRPASRFVANFVGQGVFLSGKVLDSHHVEIELGVLEVDISHQHTSDKVSGKGYNVDVLVRPDDIVHDDESSLKAQVLHKAFRVLKFYILYVYLGVALHYRWYQVTIIMLLVKILALNLKQIMLLHSVKQHSNFVAIH